LLFTVSKTIYFHKMKSDRSEKRNYVAVLSLVRTIRATKLKVKTTATKLTNMGVGRGQNPPGF